MALILDYYLQGYIFTQKRVHLYIDHLQSSVSASIQMLFYFFLLLPRDLHNHI